jgi:hypothetical protein
MPSKTYSLQNIQILSASVSSQCSFTANMLCFSCIKTLPPQTEISISFMDGGSQVRKVFDISYSPDNKMKFVNMHD